MNRKMIINFSPNWKERRFSVTRPSTVQSNPPKWEKSLLKMWQFEKLHFYDSVPASVPRPFPLGRVRLYCWCAHVGLQVNEGWRLGVVHQPSPLPSLAVWVFQLLNLFICHTRQEEERLKRPYFAILFLLSVSLEYFWRHLPVAVSRQEFQRLTSSRGHKCVVQYPPRKVC